MSVELRVTLQEREADALLRASEDGRGGWHANPSQVLQSADFKITSAIQHARSTTEETPE